MIGHAPVKTLIGKNGKFGFGQIEPTAVLGRVMPFETLHKPPGFGGREGFVERGLDVGVEIVLNRRFPGVREENVR